jgi:sporulation protein YlmC with PRC-barrel domain
MAKPDKRRLSHRPTAAATLRQQIAVRRAIADQVVSLANLLRCPVLNDAGTRIGKVSDIVVRWDAGVSHPPVVGILIGVGSGFALLDRRDVELTQAEVRLRSGRQMVSRPVWREGDVALARDVLDHQLVDIAGVQVVRAADVYLLHGPHGWELALPAASVDTKVLLSITSSIRNRTTGSRSDDGFQPRASICCFRNTKQEPNPAASPTRNTLCRRVLEKRGSFRADRSLG